MQHDINTLSHAQGHWNQGVVRMRGKSLTCITSMFMCKMSLKCWWTRWNLSKLACCNCLRHLRHLVPPELECRVFLLGLRTTILLIDRGLLILSGHVYEILLIQLGTGAGKCRPQSFRVHAWHGTCRGLTSWWFNSTRTRHLCSLGPRVTSLVIFLTPSLCRNSFCCPTAKRIACMAGQSVKYPCPTLSRHTKSLQSMCVKLSSL